MPYAVYYFCFQCGERKEPTQGLTCDTCQKQLAEICENCGQPVSSDEGDACTCDEKTENLDLG